MKLTDAALTAKKSKRKIRPPCNALHEDEEAELVDTIDKAVLVPEDPIVVQDKAYLLRLRRKLLLRQTKRQLSLPSFDLDARVTKMNLTIRKSDQQIVVYREAEKPHSAACVPPSPSPANSQEDFHDNAARTDTRLDEWEEAGDLWTSPFIFNFAKNTGDVLVAEEVELDVHRLSKYLRMTSADRNRWPFCASLYGTSDRSFGLLVSPATARVLKPYIRRDYDTLPRKLALHLELRERVARRGVALPPARRAPIDYVYFRKQLLDDVNRFLSDVFWPSIDMTESLDLPDQSIVALYGHKVIGCAFMTSSGYITYIATHPDWRRAGIASFMLFHLLQAWSGRDVTLHVAPDSAGMFLCQRFRFRPEQYVLRFYDSIHPDSSLRHKWSNAFLLRLRR